MSSRVDDPSKTDESVKPNMVTAGDDPTPKNEDVDGKSDTDDSVMGALLKDEESYKKELTKRRVLRGRLRGKIQEVQAAMECIIVPEGQKTTDELQALETKESLLHDQLRRAEQDIAELQQLRQEVVSKIGKEQYRSSSSKSVFSVTDRIRGGTSTSEGYLSLASDGGANQSDDEHEDKQKANDDEHEDKDKTRDSRTVPGKGEDQRASVVVVKASPRSLAEMPVPRSHTHKAREHAGVGQRENTRRGVRSGINTQGVSKLALPECEDVLDLDSHLEVVEGILEESGAGSYVKGNEGQLTFVLREDIRMACVGKLLTTLPSGAVRDCAKRAAQRSRYCWERVKEQLRCRFCKRSAIISNIRESLAKLSYGGPGKVDQFLDAAESIVLRCATAYRDNSETWRVIRGIVDTLPSGIAERVISEVKREARLQRGSYRDVGEEDWETLLSFSPEVQGGGGDITVVDIIRDVSRTAEDTSRREADRVAWVAQTTNSQVSGTGGAPPGKGAASSTRPPKQSLESWARGFKASFVVTVRQLDEQEIKSTFQPDDWKPLRSKGKGQDQRFGRVVGAVVGYNDEAKGKAVIAKVGSGKRQGPDVTRGERISAEDSSFSTSHEESRQGNGGLNSCSREEEKGVAREEVEDKVCLIYLEVPVELQVRTDVVSAVDPKYRIQGVKGTIDPGAGRTYLCLPKDQGARKCIPTTRVAKWAKLADGSRTAITEEAEVYLTLWLEGEAITAGPHMVRVLYSEQVEDKVGLLIGRDIGSRVGLQLDLATGTVSRSRRGLCAERRQVEDDSAEAIDVIRYVHDSVMRYIDKPGGGRGVGTQPSPQEEGKVIYPVLPRQEQEVARKVIATLVDKGELVVEGLPDYRLSFRRLEEHSQRDCEGQEVAVFIDLPKKGDEETTELRIPRYERAAYSKLEEAHRAVYRKLVQEFVDRGWWVKKSELQVEGHPEGKECLPASPIFLAQLEKKPRLVLDCRGVNQSLGGVSSSRRATSDVLIAVRLNGGDLIVADLQKAYYRCRLVDRWVLLATAIGEFVSDRVVFGLHFGAGCLQGAVKEIIMTMLELMKGLSEEQILLFILYYMDDIVIQEAEVEGIVRAFALLFAILRILGFVAQCDKLWAVVRPGNEEQFRQYCEGYGVVVPLSTEGTLLGVGVCMEQERMLLDCRLAQRWSAVAEFLNSTTWTKSSTFACAGVLAHDSVQGHPTLRLIGDVLRAIVGKTFSSWTWDRPFTIDNFGDGVRTAFEEIGKWISEKKPAQECVHASSLRLESESIFLTLETDSSLLGWGFSLWATRQEGVAEFCSEAEGKCFEILGAAGRWTNREAAWHSNRRELRAMFEGVSRTARLLDYWRGSHHRLGTQGTCRLSIKGDNFASIRWCNENPPCKALELRSIVRLADAIKAEISFIRNSCDVTVDITHLQGSLNTRADSLSRLLERRCANGIQIGRVLQEHLDEPLKVATVIDDIISRIGEIPSYPDELEDRLCYIPDEVSSEYRKHTGSPSLADELSLRSYDVNAALNAWKALRFAFTWWKQSTGDLPTAELQYPDTYLEEDKASFARSLQMGWAEGMDAKALRSLACIRIDDAGIARYLVNSANGSTSWAYYVPKKRMAFKRLLIRSAHRKLRHASRNASVERAIEFGFFAPSLRRLANDELAVCVTCQLKNAKREWRILPGLSGAGISDLSPDNLLRAGKEPFYAVSVDAITLGSGLLYLSVVCLMTYSVVWIAIPDQTSPSIAAGIRRAMRREGGCAGKCTLSTCVEPRCDFC